MILTEQEDGLVKVVELDEGREGQDHDDPDVNQVLRGVFVVEVWKERKKNGPHPSRSEKDSTSSSPTDRALDRS